MLWFVGSTLAAIAVLLVVGSLAPEALPQTSQQIKFVSGVVLLVYLSAIAGFSARRAKWNTAARSIVAWSAIGLALVSLYAFQEPLRNVASDGWHSLFTPSARIGDEGVVRLRVGANGHFEAQGKINGKRVSFLVDTGATHVVLTRADAARVGIDVEKLQYTDFVRTANGTTRVAAIYINEVRIESIAVKRVRAQVAGEGLDQSLLGMSFLARLSSYEFSPRELTLKQE